MAVGDILLDRGIAKVIERRGPAAPFRHVAGRLRSADLAVGNLECPISDTAQRAPKTFSFRASSAAASALRSSGIAALSLANNHTLDCGRAGLTDTISCLRGQGIAAFGAGADMAAASQPAIVTVRGLRIALLGFSDFVPETIFPNSGLPSVARASEPAVKLAVKNARGRADVVIAAFHWGNEYRQRPTTRQRLLARAAVGAGADLVLGHHSHVLQGLEWLSRPRRRAALVAYSLGNFVFDVRRPRFQPAESAILSVQLSADGVDDARFEPCRIVRGCPTPLKGTESVKALARMAVLCAELKTRVADGAILPPRVGPGP